MRKYVITGGPCSGKTTTINELRNLGYHTIQESARAVIEQEQPNGILPWTNVFEFQKLVLKKQLELEERINGSTTFLDRGCLDGIAYCWQAKIQAPQELIEITRSQRYTAIFLLEQLSEYKTDGQRKEDSTVAKELHKLIEQAYKKFGYRTITIPVLVPKERAQFVIKQLKEAEQNKILLASFFQKEVN